MRMMGFETCYLEFVLKGCLFLLEIIYGLKYKSK